MRDHHARSTNIRQVGQLLNHFALTGTPLIKTISADFKTV